MQRIIETGQNDRGLPAATAKRRLRRLRALQKFAERQAFALRAPVRASAILALVGLILFSPLLLDDMVFRASYLMRPSEDSISVKVPALLSDLPILKLQGGTLSMPPALSGKARTGEALAALVKGGTARLALKGPVFVLDVAGAGGVSAEVADYTSGEAPDTAPIVNSPLIDALKHAAFETLVIRDGTMLLDLGSGRREELSSIDADVSIKRRTATRIKGSAKLRGEAIRFDLVFGARIERRGSAKIPVKGRIDNGLFQVDLDGRLDVGRGISLAGTSAEITVANVRSIARWLGEVWPSGAGLRDFSARGTLEWVGPVLAMSRGRYVIDGNEASGTLSLSLAGPRSLVAGTLAFGKFDLSPYFPLPVAVPGEKSDGGKDRWARLPLVNALKATSDVRLPMVGVLDVDLRLSAEQLRIHSAEAGRAAASLTMREGQVLLNVAEVMLPDGGRAVGEFSLSGPASYPNFAVQGRLEDVELGSISNALVGLAAVRGRGQLIFDMAASGSTGMDIMSRLTGKMEARLPDGGVVSCNHVAVAAAVRASRSSSDLCSSSVTVVPTTALARLSSGRLVANGLELTTSEDLVRFNGSIDLVTSGVDVAITSLPLRQPGGDGAAKTVRDVITVRGRTDALSIAVTP